MAYKDGEDNVAEVARRACHDGAFLGLLFEPLVLFGGFGALHLVYSRVLRTVVEAWRGLMVVMITMVAGVAADRRWTSGLGDGKRMGAARNGSACAGRGRKEETARAALSIWTAEHGGGTRGHEEKEKESSSYAGESVAEFNHYFQPSPASPGCKGVDGRIGRCFGPSLSVAPQQTAEALHHLLS